MMRSGKRRLAHLTAFVLALSLLTGGASASVGADTEASAWDVVRDMTWGVNLADLYIADIARSEGSPQGYVTDVPYEIGVWFWNDSYYGIYSDALQSGACPFRAPLPDYYPGDNTVTWIGGLFNIGVRTFIPDKEVTVTLSGSRLVWEDGTEISLSFLDRSYTGTTVQGSDGKAWYHLNYDKSKLPAITQSLNGAYFETTVTPGPCPFASPEEKAAYFFELNRFKIDQEESTDLFLSQGANVVRLPVTWTPFVDNETFEVDQAWLKAVASEVDYILESGAYCILNLHNDYLQRSYVDGEWRSDWMSDTYWEEAYARFQAIWTQIAEYFKDYPRTLLFETCNEPTASDTCYDLQLQRLPLLNQALIDIVRKSGGNNATRLLCLATPNCNTYEQLHRLTLSDQELADKNIIVELHCYNAMEYDPFDDTTPDNFDYTAATNKLFAAVDEFIEKHPDIPILLGEVGATHRESEEAMTPRVAYFYQEAEERGIPCLWWEDYFVVDNNTHYWLYDKAAGKWGRPQLLQAIQDAVDVLCVRVHMGGKELYFSSSQSQACQVVAAVYTPDGALLDAAAVSRTSGQRLADLTLSPGQLPEGSVVRVFLLDPDTWTPIAPAAQRVISA